MMELFASGSSWIWHPDWVDSRQDSAGGFVHFRKTLHLSNLPDGPVEIRITADTRFKLYINKRLAHWGPVKGDEYRWFYDIIDIRPYLKVGENVVAVHVLRIFNATTYASSFARTPLAGLYIQPDDPAGPVLLASDETWETSIDPCGNLRTDEGWDIFLHIFERVSRAGETAEENLSQLKWTKARLHSVVEDYGITIPWRLCPRMIPFLERRDARFKTLHNVRSDAATQAWERVLLSSSARVPGPAGHAVQLEAGSKHHVEIEAEQYVSALLTLRFAPSASAAGSRITMTYAECYEDEVPGHPFCKVKGYRHDTTKRILGPSDHYTLAGGCAPGHENYAVEAPLEEAYQPFHFRSFRYIALDIEVGNGPLEFRGLDAVEIRYPLGVQASFDTGVDWTAALWTVSVDTVQNCIHDCFEDCPFYEQMQYAMDMRSTSLFTYLLSADDRIARQGILQLHDSFMPSIGLTSSRAPVHSTMKQFIPAFSLFWICAVADHYEFNADATFSRQFIGVAEAIVATFTRRIDEELGLVRAFSPVLWDYTDWTATWSPYGVPSALRRTGFSTYTNCLFSMALRRLSWLVRKLGRPGLADDYAAAGQAVASAVAKHCYDGEFFTDGLAKGQVPSNEYSQHSQVMAVLAGAVTGEKAAHVIDECMQHPDPTSQAKQQFPGQGNEPEDSSQMTGPETGGQRVFTVTSTAFSFYSLRALAAVGLYDKYFHSYWQPWRDHLAQGVSTWPEEASYTRSDCHAWGSVPIYEFLTEVAGIRPSEPGWSRVTFQPRIGLFPKLNTTVPIPIKGYTPGVLLLHVSWKPEDSHLSDGIADPTVVRLWIEGPPEASLPVIVNLPGRDSFSVNLKDELVIKV